MPEQARDLMKALKASFEHLPQQGARSDIEIAAEAFVTASLDALGLIWEPDEIAAEASALTDRAFGWRPEEGDADA